MKLTDANRPLRVLDKVIQGGLGAGNVGVLMARHGTGKVAVLTSIALDHAMDGRKTLHVAVNESVTDVRAYDDEVLQQIAESLGIQDRAKLITTVERNKQIYTYRSSGFSVGRLGETLKFLEERAEFKPEMIELQGWPKFDETSGDDLAALKALAVERGCEIWCAAHTHRDDQLDANGVPEHLANALDFIEVLISLEPDARRVNLRFIKTHNDSPPSGINLEFDPQAMLIRWR